MPAHPPSPSRDLQYSEPCCEYGVAEKALVKRRGKNPGTTAFVAFCSALAFLGLGALFFTAPDTFEWLIGFILCTVGVGFGYFGIQDLRGVTIASSAFVTSDKKGNVHLHEKWDQHWYNTHCEGRRVFWVRLWGWKMFRQVRGYACSSGSTGYPIVGRSYPNRRTRRDSVIEFGNAAEAITCDIFTSRDHEFINRLVSVHGALSSVKDIALEKERARIARDVAINALCDIIEKNWDDYSIHKKRSPVGQKDRERAEEGIGVAYMSDYSIGLNPRVGRILERILAEPTDPVGSSPLKQSVAS